MLDVEAGWIGPNEQVEELAAEGPNEQVERGEQAEPGAEAVTGEMLNELPTRQSAPVGGERAFGDEGIQPVNGDTVEAARMVPMSPAVPAGEQREQDESTQGVPAG